MNFQLPINLSINSDEVYTLWTLLSWMIISICLGRSASRYRYTPSWAANSRLNLWNISAFSSMRCWPNSSSFLLWHIHVFFSLQFLPLLIPRGRHIAWVLSCTTVSSSNVAAPPRSFTSSSTAGSSLCAVHDDGGQTKHLLSLIFKPYITLLFPFTGFLSEGLI
jgi:hypothetical protein